MDFQTVERNLRGMFTILASRRTGGEVREFPGLSIAALGSSFQMFNAAFFNSPVHDEVDFQRRVTLAAVQMRARELPWALWLCEDWLPSGLRRKVVKILNRQGLYLASEMPGMAATRLRVPERPLPTLDIRLVTNEPLRQVFCEIGACCFHVPLPWFCEIFDEQTPRRESCYAYVGYLEGEAVATAATVIAADVIGVYNIATLPSARGQGVGEAVMRHVLAEATRHSGLQRSILQATRQGLSLYQRMGYANVTKFLVFTG